MKLLLIITLFIVYSRVGSLYAQYPGIDTRILSESALEDLQKFKKVIVDYHPDPFRYISRTEWEARFQALSDSIEKLNTIKIIDFYRLLQPLMNAVRDQHLVIDTQLFEDLYFSGEELYFPFQITPSDSGYFTVEKTFHKELDSLVGKKIISINDYDYLRISQLVKACGSPSSSSDYAGTFYYTFNTLNFNWFFKLCVDQSDYFKIEFLHGLVIKVNGQKLSYIRNNALDSKIPKREAPVFKISKDSSKALLRISSFYFKAFDQSYKQAKENLRLFLEELRILNVKSLTIDIRGNEGGSPKYSTYLASFFYPHPYQPYNEIYASQKAVEAFPKMFRGRWKVGKSIHTKDKALLERFRDSFYICQKGFIPFQGDLAIIIDSGVGSAASEFTALMKNHPYVKIYGSETSGDCCAFSGVLYRQILLYHSNLIVKTPLLISKAKGVKTGLYGTKPDFNEINPELFILEEE